MSLESFLDGFEERDWRTAPDGAGPIRFAFVGAGWWTRDHAIPAARTSTLCEPAVVVSSSTEKAERVAAENGLATGITYEQFHDGAAAAEYDAVYVCTPNALHLQQAEAAAELGKAVLCEKPMEATAERADRMVEVAEAADVPLMIAYRMHTEPSIRRMRELVRSGAIGEPAQLIGWMLQPLLEMIPDPDQWRLNPDLAGEGGSVTDLGVYPINTARFVLDRDPVAVTAQTVSTSEGYGSVPDERAAFTLEYEGGVLASYAASQNADNTGGFRVVGTEGSITHEPAFFQEAERTLTLQRGDTEAEVSYDRPDQMTEEFTYFADRLLADEPIEPDGAHGALDVRTIEAVYEAARRGRRVAVDR